MTAKVAAIVRRDAGLALSYPLNFWLPWVSIVITVLGFWFVSRLIPPSAGLGIGGHRGNYFDYVVINVAFFSLQATALTSFSQTIRRDQLSGTLEAMLVTPTPLPLLILSSGLWFFTITLLQIVWYLAIAMGLFGMRLAHADIPMTLLFLLLIITSSVPFGVFSAAAIMRFKQAGPSNFLVGGAASLLSGVIFPVALFPLPLRWLAWLLPITHGLSGVRASLHGAGWSIVSPDAIWLACASVILLPLSLAVFARAVRRAKADGTLADY